jgi:hypothetical protein
VGQDDSVLGAVKTSARDAPTAEKKSARLRVLTAPARGVILRHLRDGRGLNG